MGYKDGESLINFHLATVLEAHAVHAVKSTTNDEEFTRAAGQLEVARRLQDNLCEKMINFMMETQSKGSSSSTIKDANALKSAVGLPLNSIAFANLDKVRTCGLGLFHSSRFFCFSSPSTLTSCQYF